MQSFEKLRFEYSLQWVLLMERDETLDRLRNISCDHMTALLNLEQQLLIEKPETAKAGSDAQARQLKMVTSQRDAAGAKASELDQLVRDLERILASRDDEVATLTTSNKELKDKLSSTKSNVDHMADRVSG
jgi:septal ring factor EnvC (AmiA/AmiB activator)